MPKYEKDFSDFPKAEFFNNQEDAIAFEETLTKCCITENENDTIN